MDSVDSVEFSYEVGGQIRVPLAADMVRPLRPVRRTACLLIVGFVPHYITHSVKRSSRSTVGATIPTLKRHSTLVCPHARTCRRPSSSLRRPWGNSLRWRALVVTPGFRCTLPDLAICSRILAPVVADHRDAPQLRAEGCDLLRAKGTVHQIGQILRASPASFAMGALLGGHAATPTSEGNPLPRPRRSRQSASCSRPNSLGSHSKCLLSPR